MSLCVVLTLFDFSTFLSLLYIFSLIIQTSSSTMWWTNSLCTPANEDLGTLCRGRPSHTLEWVRRALAPSQEHHQALLPVIRTFLFQERRNSKVGSRTTQEVVCRACNGRSRKILSIFNQIIPFSAPKFVDWEQTSTRRTGQENWPTKVLVSMWFKSATNLATIIELLRVVIDELKKKPYELKGQVVTARLEMSPKRKSWAKEAHALFYKGIKNKGGDESEINVV